MRVPWNVHWLVKPVLDAGAMGIIFPMIRSAADAEQAVRAVRYPPEGERGFGPFYAPARFGLTMQTYADPADREILCILLIEHKDAIEDIEAILAVPGVDACLIAPFDLAMSYGHRDGPAHAEVQAGIARAEQAIAASPVHLGGLALTGEIANADDRARLPADPHRLRHAAPAARGGRDPRRDRPRRLAPQKPALSSQMVTGPSLIRRTAMCAPKRPVATGRPASRRRVQNCS